MKKIYFIITLTILLLAVQHIKPVFSADEPFYATLRPKPNVMIILDRSGSMQWLVTSDNTDGACTATAPDTTTTQANKSRVCIARDVLFDLLDDDDDGSITSPDDDVSLGVSLGYMRYYLGDIALRQDVGTPYNTIWGSTTTADAGTLNVGGNTPLGQSLMDALTYFQTSNVILNDGCKICRKNFVIVVTDGADTATCDNTTARNRSVVYAARALKNGPDGIPGNDDDIPVFVIGLGGGLSAGLQNTLNWAAYYGYGGNDPNPAPNTDTGSFTPGAQLCDSGNVDPANEAKSGYAFIATDAASLATSIKQAINLAKQGSYTRSAPVLTTAGIGGANRIYQGFFDLGANINWQGHLLAWDLDANGDLIDSPINNPCTSSLSTPNTGALRELYDAGRTLTYSTCGGYVAPSARKIWTVVNTALNSPLTEFQVSSTTSTSAYQGLLCTALIKTSPNSCTTAEETSTAPGSANELINFIRFASPTFNGSGGARNNNWHLGDIWHSTPTIVGPPFGIINSTAYKTFKTNNANRTQILILGANDGMLHALDDTNKGKEMWSFIPNNLLGKLKNLSTGHSFFMDASPTAADVCLTANCGTINETYADWKTVVISGERDGGKAYFALKLVGTTTTTPEFKWEFTDACLGNTWSKPTIGKVRYSTGANTVDKWVTFFGGGVSSSALTANCDGPNSSNGGNIGNYVYAVNIEDGKPLGSGPNATKKKVDSTNTSNNVPSALRPVDLNGDYYVDTVYFGDALIDNTTNPVTTKGRMYRWDVSNLANNNNGSLTRFFDPNAPHYYINSTGNRVVEGSTHNSRPIYYRPSITLDKNFRPVVVFGTGNIDELKATPPEITTIDFVYAIRQEAGYAGNEADQSGVTELWKVILNCQNSNPNTACGERLTGPTMIFGGYVLFITYRPEATTNTCTENGSTVSCEPGSAWLYIVDLETRVIVNGSNGNGEKIGPGIGSMTCSGDKCYTTTSNDIKITKHDIPDKSPNADVIYWRER